MAKGLAGGAKTPEQEARSIIDQQLLEAGWLIQSCEEINLSAGCGIAICEFPMAAGYGFADYLLYLDKQAIGALKAKPPGFTLSGVKPQIDKYSAGLPPNLPAPIRPLPFLYVSTGIETYFVNLLDPQPRSRRVFSFYRPETIAEWLHAPTLPEWIRAFEAGQAFQRNYPALNYHRLRCGNPNVNESTAFAQNQNHIRGNQKAPNEADIVDKTIAGC